MALARASSSSRSCLLLVSPAAGLQLADALQDEPALQNYHLLPSVRGDLLAKLGRNAEARAEFQRAAGLTNNKQERELLLARARAMETDARLH